MIEAFDEVMGDTAAVEDCRVWLLKQKQTQDWKTTKATADAVYALLCAARTALASDKLVEVTVGGINVTPGNRLGKPPTPAVEAGTGFYEHRFWPAPSQAQTGRDHRAEGRCRGGLGQRALAIPGGHDQGDPP